MNFPKKVITLPGIRVILGRSRGKRIGIPTINLDPSQAPKNLQHGIYACYIRIAGKRYRGAMHYGLRPVFDDTKTLEVHVLDEDIDGVPETVDLMIVGRIRDVLDFPDTEGLLQAINDDILQTRAMLAMYEETSSEAFSRDIGSSPSVS